MNLSRFAASVPAGVYEIACLQLSHSTFGVHRRVFQQDDVTVAIDGALVTFPGWRDAGAWLGDYPTTDDSGRAQRTITMADPDNAVHALIEATVELSEPVMLDLYYFTSDDLNAPKIRERYEVQTSQPDDDKLTITAQTLDIANLTDPVIRHTLANTPGLRGR